MNKFTKLLYDIFGYVMFGLFIGVSITVPAAIIVWAVKWILVMVGVIV